MKLRTKVAELRIASDVRLDAYRERYELELTRTYSKHVKCKNLLVKKVVKIKICFYFSK